MHRKYAYWLSWWAASVLLLIPGMVQRCGSADEHSYSVRMVEGEVPSKDHPSSYNTVALVGKLDKQSFCSGSIIAEDLIVTAAHCIFKKRPEQMQVMFGRDVEDPNLVYIDVVEKQTFKVNQKYESNFDIGWLKLKEAIPSGYRPLEIWHNSELFTPGVPLTIAGYGRTASKCSFNDPSCQGGKLLKVDTLISRYLDTGRLYSLLVIDSQNGSGPCFGDSGGPAYFNYNSQWYIVGDFMGWDKLMVNEDRDTVCDHGEGIYNFVGDYAQWIEESSSTALSYDKKKNPRTPIKPLPVLAEEPTNFFEWCSYSNHMDPAWYTVQRLIRLSVESELKLNPLFDGVKAFEDCHLAAQTVENYISRESSLKLVGFDPLENVDFARLEDIRPLKALAGFGLRELILVDHSIANLSVLEDLWELEHLEIIDNHVSQLRRESVTSRPLNIRAFSRLKNLKISQANVDVDLSSIDQASELRVLDLGFTQVKSLEALSKLDLVELKLENVSVLDGSYRLSGLSGLTQLILKNLDIEQVEASFNDLKELQLWNLPKMKRLSFSWGNKLESAIISGLGLEELGDFSDLSQLNELIIVGNQQLRKIGNIENLAKLRVIEIIDNPRLSELGVLSQLEALEEFSLRQTRVEKLNFASQMKLLRSAELSHNQLGDLEFLVNLTNLEYLDLSHNLKLDISRLHSLAHLERLALENLKGEGISSLDTMHSMDSLTEINLKGNSLASLDSLVQFKNLEVILASENFVSNVDKLAELPALDYIEMIDNPLEDKDCPIEEKGGFCRFEWVKIDFNF